MTKVNITLTLTQDLLREARILAAQEGISISGLLANLIEERVRTEKDYESAMRRAVARMRKGMSLGWSRPASRDKLISERVFVDSNILVYAHDSDQGWMP
jgi:hypothetical protein